MAATQFHELIDRLYRALWLGPLLLRPSFTLQPVDAAFVAERLADLVCAADARNITVCGPELLSSREMAAAWLTVRPGPTLVVPAPAVGMLAGFAAIARSAGVAGGRSWEEWLHETVARSRTAHEAA